MNEEFFTILKVLGWTGYEDGPKVVSPYELVRHLSADPDRLDFQRSFIEHRLAHLNRPMGEALLRLLFSTTSYLSDVLGGPVPVMMPRDDVNALLGAGDGSDGAAAALVRSLKKLVRTQAEEILQPQDAQLVAQLEEIVAKVGSSGVPTRQMYMNSEQIGKLLGLAAKTVRRLFNEGKLIGKKVGNEWRATREQVEDSPYMKRGRRRGRAAVE
jgi:hypothetical protein